MRIVTLMENTEGFAGCRFEHGLSFYMETAAHKLLFDSGAGDAFLENAALLGVDVSAADCAFLSHGHSDHSGGLLAFAALAPNAPIYLQQQAGGDYFRKDPDTPERYIGIDKRLLTLPQVRFLAENTVIDEELSVFMGVTGRRRYSESNRRLMMRAGGELVEDSWVHEQYLVVQTEGKRILFTGCAHNGILNILDRFEEIYGGEPDLCLGGFHFMKATDYTAEESANILAVAEELAGKKTVFYSGHCTGLPAFMMMKPILGDKLRMLHSATAVE